MAWFEYIDPGTHRRIKGLRLVAAYGIAAMLGTLLGGSHGLSSGTLLGPLAGGFALWASVFEGQSTRASSSRDLGLMCVAAVVGAASMIAFSPVLDGTGWPGAELTLVTGAFLVGYLKRYGILGAGLGSQIYIGQLLAYGAGLKRADLPTVVVAGVIAAVGAVVPRLLSGPAEHPVLAQLLNSTVETNREASRELRMGLQAAIAALVIVLLNHLIRLEESAWAITACTYVIAGTTLGTIDRVRRRIIGTMIGVPLGLGCLPIALHAPIVAWALAALAMIIYSMALPERYDIACGAYAFTLVLTLAVSGESSAFLLASRAWETLIGGALGLATALVVFPLKTSSPAGRQFVGSCQTNATELR
ncbi:MAG TPA: FUSC family protein [Candidatus Aquilonibacter sp.]|nr:FUSC family protein [Candidatus Aquilonibacter sp.]